MVYINTRIFPLMRYKTKLLKKKKKHSFSLRIFGKWLGSFGSRYVSSSLSDLGLYVYIFQGGDLRIISSIILGFEMKKRSKMLAPGAGAGGVLRGF